MSLYKRGGYLVGSFRAKGHGRWLKAVCVGRGGRRGRGSSGGLRYPLLLLSRRGVGGSFLLSILRGRGPPGRGLGAGGGAERRLLYRGSHPARAGVGFPRPPGRGAAGVGGGRGALAGGPPFLWAGGGGSGSSPGGGPFLALLFGGGVGFFFSMEPAKARGRSVQGPSAPAENYRRVERLGDRLELHSQTRAADGDWVFADKKVPRGR